MQVDFASRELTIKLVYYGPALSGKTTNLLSLHKIADPQTSGRLMTLETRDDRTLFFDLLPLRFETGETLALRLKVFTVPGQVIHASTRRIVLQNADGVAFIADSQLSQTHTNAAAFIDLQQNLKSYGRALRDVPLVIQYNKQDLEEIRTIPELRVLANRGREPVFAAVATECRGVLETFVALLHATWLDLNARHNLEHKFHFCRTKLISEVLSHMGSNTSLQQLLRTGLKDNATGIAHGTDHLGG